MDQPNGVANMTQIMAIIYQNSEASKSWQLSKKISKHAT
jgi:hypothetical protein